MGEEQKAESQDQKDELAFFADLNELKKKHGCNLKPLVQFIQINPGGQIPVFGLAFDIQIEKVHLKLELPEVPQNGPLLKLLEKNGD